MKPTFKEYHYKLQYFNNEIEFLYQVINNIKNINHHEINQYIILIMHSHLHLFISFVENMASHTMHMTLIKLVS
jgi:hypothetical protein